MAHSAGTATSTRMTRCRLPSSRLSASSRSSRRAHSASFAPRAWSCFASSLPIPALAPVIATTMSLSWRDTRRARLHAERLLPQQDALVDVVFDDREPEPRVVAAEEFAAPPAVEPEEL